MGGEYFSVDGPALMRVWNDQAALDAFLTEQRFPANGSDDPLPPNVLHSVEDAWDLVQNLLEGKLGLGGATGEQMIEGGCNGEFCGVISADSVRKLSLRLLALLRERNRVMAAIQSLDYGEIYHGQHYAGDSEEVFGLFSELTRLFVESAARGQGLGFRIM